MPTITVGAAIKKGLPRLRRDLNRAVVANARIPLERLMEMFGNEMIDIAKDLARSRLENNRPPDRRRTNGPHYIDSFATLSPEFSGNRFRGGITNTHPAAAILEKTVDPHPIVASGKAGGNGLRAWFPVATMSPARGGQGDYTATGNPKVIYGPGIGKGYVDHPGHTGFRIMGDAADKARASITVKVNILAHMRM